MKPKNILFICTGNTCRSPMAMALLQQMLQNKGISDITVASAGVAAYSEPVSSNTVAVLKELEIDISGYVSKPVTAEVLRSADLIIVMGENHKAVLQPYVEDGKLVVLGGGISDPYGGNLEIYRRTRDQIKSAITALAEERGLFGD